MKKIILKINRSTNNNGVFIYYLCTSFCLSSSPGGTVSSVFIFYKKYWEVVVGGVVENAGFEPGSPPQPIFFKKKVDKGHGWELTTTLLLATANLRQKNLAAPTILQPSRLASTYLAPNLSPTFLPNVGQPGASEFFFEKDVFSLKKSFRVPSSAHHLQKQSPKKPKKKLKT